MKYCDVSLVKNIFGKYVVTKWLDYEYQKYSERKIFSDKDLAADYAWKLFGGDEEFKIIKKTNITFNIKGGADYLSFILSYI